FPTSAGSLELRVVTFICQTSLERWFWDCSRRGAEQPACRGIGPTVCRDGTLVCRVCRVVCQDGAVIFLARPREVLREASTSHVAGPGRLARRSRAGLPHPRVEWVRG